MTVDAHAFRDAMACLAMPVAVVTALDQAGLPHGTTLGSVTSLSLSPPLVMFALGHRVSVHPAICGATDFCISVLSADQQDAAERFVGDRRARFAAPDLIDELHGVPVVRGALAWLACTRHNLTEAGDHTIVIGRVEHAQRNTQNTGGPLLYHERGYHALFPAPAT